MREPVLLLLATGVPVLVMLRVGRAPWRRWVAAPLVVVLVTLGGALLWMLLRPSLAARLALPRDAGALYVAGWVFFLALGVLAGLGLTPRDTPLQVQRGARLAPSVRWPRRARRRPGGITLAGLPLDVLDETKHIKVIGTTGTGKSTAIREVLQAALDRGDRAIIADPDGGYLSRFYDPKAGDQILNPFEPQAAPWDLFGEIQQPYDVEQLARALIPDHPGEERSWRNYARVFLACAIRQLWELGKTHPQVRTVAELYQVLTLARHDELAALLDGTPARTYLDGANERMFGSIRAVTATYVASLAHQGQSQGRPVSLRQWIRSADRPDGPRTRALFLPYSATQIAALRSVISAWLRLAIFETMNGPERTAQDPWRLWFFVDELDALGAIDGLKDALARLRKFGGRCMLGFQSVAQVSSTYGIGDAQTLIENCGTTLILRCSASERGGTAQFASRLIGEREVLRRQESFSRRPGEWRSSRSVSQQRVIESAVLSSEIEQLADLTGFLKRASRPSWHRVRLTGR